MRQITCEHCGRVLAKLDGDGTLHIRHSSSGIEFVATVVRMLFVCPKFYYNRNGRVACGHRTMFVNPAFSENQAEAQKLQPAREKVAMSV